MRHLIFLSGDLTAGPLLDKLLLPCDYMVAADGGSDHVRRIGLLPNLVVGDFDSIAPESRVWIDANRIPVLRFPTAKDATDSEIAVEESLAAVSAETPPGAVELVILGAFGSRPDHVLGNQLMAASIAEKGYRVTLSDGISLLYALHGPATLSLNMSDLPGGPWAVSSIAVTAQATGLTYTGLRYPLTDFTLPFGSTRGLSNEPFSKDSQISISLTEGTILVCLTPAV